MVSLFFIKIIFASIVFQISSIFATDIENNGKETKSQSYQSGNAWTESDSEVFIRYGKCFVPERETQLDIISTLIPIQTERTRVVELCSGEGLLSEAILESHPTVILDAYDGSDVMLTSTKERLKRFEDRFAVHKFDIFSSEWRSFSQPVHAFVSSLAIHHLDEEQKKQLFKDLYKALVPGGALISVDLVMPTHPLSLKVAAQCWDENTKKRFLEIDGTLDGFDVFKIHKWNYFDAPPEDDSTDKPSLIKPSPIFSKLKWLEEAGFKNVEVFWMLAGHAIYGGYK